MTENYKKTIVSIVTKLLPNCRIYLYGSRARQDHSEGSDIDIALDNNAPISWTILAKIREELEESTIPVTIDVVDVHAIDKEFHESIAQDWKIWKN
jgi:predicted nucleotidyltransferase